MKQTLGFLAILLITVFTISSCSKKDNPTDNDLFLGTYSGKTSYTKIGASVELADGKVVVTKLGDKYSFNFKDNGDIPAISNITIEKGQSVFLNTSNGYTGLITISASKLHIAVGKDGAAWTADCSR